MIKKNFTIETVLTLLAIVVGFGVAYGSLTTRVKDVEAEVSGIHQMAIDIAVIKQSIKNIEENIK